MKAIWTPILVCLMLLAGCRERDMGSYAQIRKAPLVVVAHDSRGGLKDFRVIKNTEPIQRITIRPSGDDKEVYVTVFGTKRHETLQKDMYVGTEVADGYLGKIAIDMQDGIAVQIKGNSFGTPSPVSKTALELIARDFKTGSFLPLDKSLIEIEWAEPTLSSDETHRIALDAIKDAVGISDICSFSVHSEERNGRAFRVVTFLAAPLSDCTIENYLYKVGVNPTNGQVLFIRRPAD
ncbi:MAG: hypothetical protein WCK89_15965 [bacterium]